MTALQLRGVDKRYGDVDALTGVDLTVGRGEVVAMLGPNGAGKTTTFELLLGLASPTSGSVQVLGEPPGPRTRRRTGVMLQNAGLPENTTVVELVQLIARSYPTSLPVPTVLRRVGLDRRERNTVTTLSGGERQRLLLAMAVVGVPDLLLLDEPTAALDVASRRAFWQHARAGAQAQPAILFATHDLAEAEAVADRVVVLQSGRTIADATPSELKRNLASTVVTVTTDASIDVARSLPAVERVEIDSDQRVGDVAEGQRFRLFTADAERTLTHLLRTGHRAAEPRVVDAALEDAFLHLTRQYQSASEPEPAA